MTATAAVLSDLTLNASAHVRAGRTATIADLVAGRAPNFVLAHKATRTLDNLREAHAAIGADRLATALGTLSAPAIRAVLSRLDPHRTAISRLPRVDVTFLLSELAAGGPVCPPDDFLEPIGAVRFAIVRPD